MKKEELFEALSDIDPNSVEKARAYKKKKPKIWTKVVAAAACLAVIIGVIWGVPSLRNTGLKETAENSKTNESADNTTQAIKTVLTAYPTMIGQGMSPDEFMSGADNDWWESYIDKRLASMELQGGMNEYYSKMMQQLLTGDEDNTVCSPLNTYMALAMLAEITDGNTREQILNVLNVKDIETLRKNVNTVWNANYVDIPILTSVLANSMWLKDGVNFNDDTLNTLASDYYASSFVGDPASEAMNEALRKWTDDNTGGLLKEYIGELKLNPTTVIGLMSTIYYKALWNNDFAKAATAKETFHGVNGDTVVDMMHKYEQIKYLYRTDSFASIGLSLDYSGTMYFFLPNEGVDVNSLLSNPDVFKAMGDDYDDPNFDFLKVNMSIPKFKVSAKTDLNDAIKALGITDVFDPVLADFSPLTKDSNGLFVDRTEHAAMVEIDEKGVTGAAYTAVLADGMGAEPEEIYDFVLDRPFMFVITGADGSILFAGVVRNIN
ncbi:MAG: serpin family protein [Lachnospiraceae bacterium]|nr:serpin family protein [Lachnospiraceae bacterium]